MSKLLRVLQPLKYETKIPFQKSDNYVLIYINAKIELSVFTMEFKDMTNVLGNKIADFKIQKIENKHILVLLKIRIHGKNEFKLKVDFFDLTQNELKAQIYKVDDVEQLEIMMNKMEGALQVVKKQDFGYERKKRQAQQQNKEFFAEYKKHKSLNKLVELGVIHLKDVIHYQGCLEALEKEDQKLKKKVKREEDA